MRHKTRSSGDDSGSSLWPVEHGARQTWIDERLGDLSRRVDSGFERVDRDVRELRVQIEALRDTVIRGNIGMLVGFISVLAAIIARGG